MESSLFDKLPSGGSWWNIQYAHAEKWMQAPYNHTSTNQVRSSPPALDEPTKKTVTTSFSHLIPQQHTPTMPCSDGKKRDSTRVFKAMLDAIDPCSQLYTRDQETDAIQTLRDRLLSFVTGLAQTYFGPKKSRVLSLWLSNNRIKEADAHILEEFLRFVFEEKADTWSLYLGPRGEWYIKN